MMCRTNKKRRLNVEGIVGIACIIAIIFAIVTIFKLDSDTPAAAKRSEEVITQETSVTTTTAVETLTTTIITPTSTQAEKVYILPSDSDYMYKMSAYKLVEVSCNEEVENVTCSTCVTTTSTTETTTETKVETITVNSDDVVLLAKLIEAEGGSIPEEARARIGAVVVNRRKSELFPDTIDAIAYSGQYETVNCGLLPSNPSEENLELARFLLELSEDSEAWYQYCLDIKISDKTVFQANSCVDMSEYAYKIVDEYGTLESGFSWHMCYWESIYDYSDYGTYSEIIISPDN